jgi:integrase
MPPLAAGESTMSIWQDERGRYHVGIMAGGKRVHRTLPPGAGAREAKQLESELRAAIGRQRAPVIPGDPGMPTVMAAYITHCDTLRSPDTARHHAARIGQWLEGKRASEARQVAAHIVRDMTGHYAPATINRSLGALKKALTMAWEAGHTGENWGAHIKRLPENNQRDTHLSLDQVRQITDHASEQVRAAVWIALLTGCRRGEILKIQPGDIGPDSLTIRAGNTKTLRTRVVPIVAPLRPWLAYIPLQINAEGLKSGFRRAREAAGMAHVHFHDLRHSCATILLASGADLYTIAKILGHSTIKVTERYAYHQVEAQRAALDKAFG